MGNAYLLRMPAGIPGVINRMEVATVEPRILDPNTPPTAYGTFVKNTSTGLQPAVGSGDVTYPTVLAGLIARPYPVQEYSTNEALGSATPDPNRPADIMTRGFMTVFLAGVVAAARGGQVYLVTTATTGYVAGTISASATNATAVTGCVFTGAADANGNVEIAFNI